MSNTSRIGTIHPLPLYLSATVGLKPDTNQGASPSSSRSVRFEANNDLFQKLDKQKNLKQEAEQAAKIPLVLGDTFFTARGSVVKGIDFLQLIYENRPGWLTWFNQGDLSSFDLGRRVAEHIDLKSLKKGETVQQMVSRQLSLLEELGCLQCTYSSYNPSERKFKLTAKGKAILKQYQETGKLSAVKVQTFMGFNFSSAEFGVNDTRSNQIQVTLTQNRIGQSGWDLMKQVKKLSEPLITPFSAFERQVTFGRLAEALGFRQVSDRSFLTQVKQLQEAGLLEISKPWLDTEPRIYLTKKAKTLLMQDSPHKAFQINDEDISAMVDETMTQIEKQKGLRKETLTKVQAEQAQIQEKVEGKKNLLATRQNELKQRQARLNPSDLELVEIKAEITLLERQIKLYSGRLDEVKEQSKLACQLYAQWLEFVAKKVEKLADAKVKLALSQNNKLLNEFLENLKQLGAAKGMMNLGDNANQKLEELVEENLIYSQVAVDMNLEDWEIKNGLSSAEQEAYLDQLKQMAGEAVANEAVNGADTTGNGSKKNSGAKS
jgi:hypothetical protein